jgi:hypothetical protein
VKDKLPAINAVENERRQHIEDLRQALLEGEEGGSAGEWDLETFLSERRRLQH